MDGRQSNAQTRASRKWYAASVMVGALVSAVVGPPAWVPPLILVAVAAAGVTWALWRAEKREEES